MQYRVKVDGNVTRGGRILDTDELNEVVNNLNENEDIEFFIVEREKDKEGRYEIQTC